MHGCKEQIHHAHQHFKGCGHQLIQHGDHEDYLHDGHLCHPHGDHMDEHALEVSATNPDVCKDLSCKETAAHAKNAGIRMQHGDHTDYLVNGRLHHVHGEHCDDHGPVLTL